MSRKSGRPDSPPALIDVIAAVHRWGKPEWGRRETFVLIGAIIMELRNGCQQMVGPIHPEILSRDHVWRSRLTAGEVPRGW